MSRVLQRLGEADTDLANERARLVRLCTRLTGDREAAEDLAQETLLVAWRDAHALRDPLAREHWLAGIARNLCLRWARARGRERRRTIVAGTRGEVADAGAIEQVADDFDLAVALERDELAELLDRALALLPPASRDVLVARYVDASPYAAIAARLGVSEKAISMRLARGKLLLRRALATDLRVEALVYGLPRTVEDADWGETRIWCHNCGRRRLIGRFDRAIYELHLRCPECHPRTGVEVCSATWPAALAGVRGYKAAFSRVARLATAQYRHALEHGAAPCIRCGRPARLRMGIPPDLRALAGSTSTGNCFATVSSTALVLFMARELGLAPAAIGLVLGAIGPGSLLGAFLAPHLPARLGLGRTVVAAVFLLHSGNLLQAFAGGSAARAAATLAAAQFTIGLMAVILNVHLLSLSQAITPDRLQGRLRATLLFVSPEAMPLGALAGGALGGFVGALWIVLSPLRILREQPLARRDDRTPG